MCFSMLLPYLCKLSACTFLLDPISNVWASSESSSPSIPHGRLSEGYCSVAHMLTSESHANTRGCTIFNEGKVSQYTRARAARASVIL